MIELTHGDDVLAVVPEHGGAILSWTRHGNHQLLPPFPGIAPGRPGGTGCFPLVPYCNRIAWRRFQWDGRAYELAANFGDHPHAIHGVGWKNPWRVDDRAADRVTMSLHHDARGESAHAWPFAFDCRLTYTLGPHGLGISFEATSRHRSPAPMGIGAHPWFTRQAGDIIAFRADGVWVNRGSLPETHVSPPPPEWDHADGRAVDSDPLDNCFTGWAGTASQPRLRISADPVLSNLQIFTPPGAGFFCIEPVSHVPDAINRPALSAAQSMHVLHENETLRGSMTFSPVR